MDYLIQNDWNKLFETEIQKPYFEIIKKNLLTEIENKKIFYPHPNNIFKAFELCSLRNTKVVILGQDPYHGQNQAMGLSFSVSKTERIPPSLKNIYKELTQDVANFSSPSHGDLTNWAKQGVLLLNAGLTVRANEPNSHKNFGWQTFTDAIIRHISNSKENVVFLLWGAFAQSKFSLIDNSKHFILTSTHPSPFSAHRGFIGCRHFSQTNNFLAQTGQTKIDWTIVN